MLDTLYLAWRYLLYNRLKTIILVLSVTLIIFLPIGLKVLVGQSARSLTARAEQTPLIVGAKGSSLELVLNALYFESDTPSIITYSQSQSITDSGLALAIPLHTRFKARKFSIVGTTVDYFDFRQCEVAQGRMMAILGECVLGSQVASQLTLAVGDSLVSSPESAFNLAGVYPLKMKVVGVLASSGTPDDRAVFVDLKTAWVIEGLAHGHQDMAKVADSAVLERKGGVIVANASLQQYNEITEANIDSFHFHGENADFPITAVIALPHDQKSSALLQGKYLGKQVAVQIALPDLVMDGLLKTILTVQNYIIAGVFVIALSTLMTAALVFMLSLRLRKREIQTMHRIGGRKQLVIGLLGSEILVVLLIGGLLALAMTLLISQWGEHLIRLLVL
ncbi:MAG: ABC transporter permease [Verrucomicrobiales bacterium]|nr:ABC transporter permease [Verrucomicrobiales bacterium]